MEYSKKGNIILYPENKRITLSGVIGPQEQMALSEVLVRFQGKRVQLFIDSKGGSFLSGLFMHDAVSLHGKVIGIVTAEAHSSAFIIFQACFERLMYPRSEIMFHAPHRGLES
jgi:ATP-dependent protease ClpP protease subunit